MSGGGGDGDIGGNHNGTPLDSSFANLANPAAGCLNMDGIEIPCTWLTAGAFTWTYLHFEAQKQPFIVGYRYKRVPNGHASLTINGDVIDDSDEVIRIKTTEQRIPIYGTSSVFWSPVIPQPQKSIDPKTIKGAIRDCISELYGKNYALVDFKATTKPARAGGDQFNGATTIRDVNNGVEANIVSDPTPPLGAQSYMVAHSLGGETPVKNPWNPWWGFVRSGRDTAGHAPSESRYPALFGRSPFLQSQVHELGVSLSELTNRYHPKDWQYLPGNDLDPADHDNGPQFENCVGQKVYSSLGLKPR